MTSEPFEITVDLSSLLELILPQQGTNSSFIAVLARSASASANCEEPRPLPLEHATANRKYLVKKLKGCANGVLVLVI